MHAVNSTTYEKSRKLHTMASEAIYPIKHWCNITMSYGRIQKQNVTLKLNNEPFGVQHRPAPRTYRL